MANIAPGSSQFKEAARRSTVRIRFLNDGVREFTIGIVVVSRPQHWCYVIAPRAKFTAYMDRNPPHLVHALLWNGNVINVPLQDLEFTEDFVKFYVYSSLVQATEMEIANVLLARNEKLYLFSSNSVGCILQPGNVTLAGEEYLKHDCPSPYPVMETSTNSTVTESGEILLNVAGMLVGIVNEGDLNDRTVAANTTVIRRQLMNNNETIAQFKQRIRNNA